MWEWCSDWFNSGYYALSAATDPRGPEQGTARVLRGGRPLTNLYGAGSVLAHYDPIKEGSGSGVAVATGWQAAGHILSSAQ